MPHSVITPAIRFARLPMPNRHVNGQGHHRSPQPKR